MAHHNNGLALVFARTETNWAQMALQFADGVNFLSGRIQFIPSDPEKPLDNAGVGSMLLAFGKTNIEALNALDGMIFLK